MRASILLILVLGLVAFVACGPREPPKSGKPGDPDLAKTFDRIKENLQKQIDAAAASGDTKKVQDLEKRLESMLKNEQKVKGGMENFPKGGGKVPDKKAMEEFINLRKSQGKPTRKDEL